MDKRAYLKRFENSRGKHMALRKQLSQREGTIDVDKLEEEASKKAAADTRKKLDDAHKREANTPPPSIIGKSFGMFTTFTKADKEKREVTGMATNEAIDSYGDIVEFAAIKEALPDYLQFGNIREMHGASAAGVVKSHDLNEKDKALYITVKVVDDMAWTKVVEGVYKGFSIGGYIEEAEPLVVEAEDEQGNKHEVFTGGFRITKIKLYEISLVDRPANPEALIESYKMAKSMEFVPDRVFLSKNQAQLTFDDQKTIVKASHLHEQKENISLPTMTMKNKIFSKAWSNVMAYFKGEGVDLENEDTTKSVTLTKGELTELLKDAVAHAVKDSEGEGDEPDTDEDTPNDGGEADTPKDGDEDPKNDGEEDEPKKEEEEEPKKEDTPNEEPKKAESSESADDVAKAVAKALTPAFEKLSEVLSKSLEVAASNAEVLKSISNSAGRSTQKGIEPKKESKDIFKGLL